MSSAEIPPPPATARSVKPGPKRPTVGRGTSTLSADSTSRPTVQRGTSTLSGDSNRSTTRPPLQRGVSTLSSRSGTVVKTKEKVHWLRKVLNFAGHASLILMIGLYTALGSYFFVRLELPNEKEVNMNKRSQSLILKESFLNRVWDYTLNYTDCGGGGNCSTTTNANKSRHDLNQLLLQEIAKYELFVYEAADSNVELHKEPDFNWNYARAMFFSATIITTIGYGNIAPVTTNGRIFCIVYAIFGIPLTLIVVADMGKLFARFVVVYYKKCKRMMADRMAAEMAAEKANSGGLPTAITKTVATAEEASARVSRMLVSLKVFGAMMLLLLYIFLGAVVFSLREDWNLFESFYFCFITMTTIGLGDIVPEHQKFMLLCTVYILIGLAITSTCIELARSEYEKSWKRMVEASKRLQGLSGVNLADALKQLGDHMELHGDIVDFDLLKDLKKAISGMRGDDEIDDEEHGDHDDDDDENDDYDEPPPPTPPPPQKAPEPLPPPPYIMYETTV